MDSLLQALLLLLSTGICRDSAISLSVTQVSSVKGIVGRRGKCDPYPICVQAHGFLAQAAMLNAAAGRSAYSVATPAFSDTRPTYSRDAQDEEGAPHSDISGSAGTPHLAPAQLALP